jgi:hypothetical protein
VAGVDSWEQLFLDVRTKDAESRDRARLAAEVRRRNEEGLARLTDRAMGEIAAVARRRTVELRAKTARTIEVEHPSYRPVDLVEGGAHMTFMRLRCGATSLHLYSHREPGVLPSLHFLFGSAQRGTGARRVESEPVCLICPLEGDRHELRTLRSRRDPSPQRVISVDDVVLRAFQRVLKP